MSFFSYEKRDKGWPDRHITLPGLELTRWPNSYFKRPRFTKGRFYRVVIDLFRWEIKVGRRSVKPSGARR